MPSLEGGPAFVGYYYDCSVNRLESLQGATETIHGNFNCHNNKLRNLRGAPKQVLGSFVCSHNQLTSLEGGPSKVGEDFDCDHNHLTDLVGAPQAVGDAFDCSFNELESLRGLPADLSTANLLLPYSPGLPLLRTLAAKEITFIGSKGTGGISSNIQVILNKYAGQGKRGVPACMVALNNIQKERNIDIRLNIRW